MVLKSTVVLFPGAWHSPKQFFLVQKLLQRSGYSVHSQRNPSWNSTNPNATSVILPLVDAGKDVVVAMHSYGGMPGPMGAKGLSKAERASVGKPGGIIGLIFLNNSIAFEGKSLLESLGGQWPHWIIGKVREAYI